MPMPAVMAMMPAMVFLMATFGPVKLGLAGMDVPHRTGFADERCEAESRQHQQEYQFLHTHLIAGG